MFTLKQLRDYIRDATNFMQFLGDINCSIAYTLLERAKDSIPFEELPGYVAACGRDALPRLKSDRNKLALEVTALEAFPSKLPFPIFHIWDGKRLIITDIDVIS